jgi:hypothetical protein
MCKKLKNTFFYVLFAIITANSMTEVQRHGITWEKDIVENIFGVSDHDLKIAKQHYTSKMDLPAPLNRVNGSDISIKTTGSKNTVCMADCLRVFDASETEGPPYHVIVVTYEQDDEQKQKRFVNITEVDLTKSRAELFGSLTREDILEMDAAVKNIPQKRKPTEQEHIQLYELRNRLQQRSGAIQLNIKCDKEQSRLQCSFNRWQTFLTEHPERIVTQSNTAEFYGKKIIDIVTSGRRIFRHK